MTGEIHVFACYHRADAQLVEAFRMALGERGVMVFHDTSDIGAGAPWRSRIEAALRTCDALLLFYGTHNLGPTQAGEVELAKIFRKPIIPIVLHGAAEPSAETGLHQRHWHRITPFTQCPDVGDVTRIVDACRQAPSNLWRDPPFLTPAGEPMIDSRRRLPRNPEKVRKLRQSLAGVGRFLRYACPSTIGAAACMLLTWLPAAEGWTSRSTLAAIAALSLSALWAFYEATPALSEWEDIILRNRLAIPQGEDAEPAKIAVVASTEQGIWALPYVDGLSALLDNVESITLGDKPIAGIDAETLASAQAVVLVWASQQNGYIAGRRVPAVQAALDWAAEHPERPFLLVGPEHAVRPSRGGWEPRIRRDDPAAAARETLATLLGRSVSRSEGWHTRARRLWALWAWTCGMASLLVVVLAKGAVEAHSASHSIGDSAKAVGASVTAAPVPLYGASEGIKAVLRQVADVQSETLQRTHALFRQPRVSVWGRVSLPNGDCICEIVGPTVGGGGTACFEAQRLANVSAPQGAATTFKSVSECAERGYLATYQGAGDPDQVGPDAQAEVYDLDGERHDVPACRVGVPHLTPPWMLCVPVAPMDQTNVSAVAPRSSSAGAVCVTDDSTWGPSLRDRTLQQTVLGNAQAFASFPLAQLAAEDYWDLCSAEIAKIEDANRSGTASSPPQRVPSDVTLDEQVVRAAIERSRPAGAPTLFGDLLLESQNVLSSIRIAFPIASRLVLWAPDESELFEVLQGGSGIRISKERSIAGCAFTDKSVVYWDQQSSQDDNSPSPARYRAPVGKTGRPMSDCAFDPQTRPAQLLCVPVGGLENAERQVLGVVCLESDAFEPGLLDRRLWARLLLDAQTLDSMDWGGGRLRPDPTVSSRQRTDERPARASPVSPGTTSP